MSQSELDQPQTSKLPLANLVARIATMASLVVSIAIIRTNNVTYVFNNTTHIFRYQDVDSYRYVLFGMVIGLSYSLLQIPFAIYFLKTGKRLINHYAFLKFDFYCDKVVTFILATALGAAFGATLDLKRNVDKLDTRLFRTGSLGDYKSKMDGFFNMAYISAVFLLVGFLSSAISSVISSLFLSRKR